MNRIAVVGKLSDKHKVAGSSDIDVAVVVDETSGDYFETRPILWKISGEVDDGPDSGDSVLNSSLHMGNKFLMYKLPILQSFQNLFAHLVFKDSLIFLGSRRKSRTR